MPSWEIDGPAVEACLRHCCVVPVVPGAVEAGLEARHLEFEDAFVAAP
jgi:hypothetical protein